MKRRFVIAVLMFAASLCGAGVASASRLHAALIVPARALHTGVRAPRHHHAHHRPTHAAVRATLARAASTAPAAPAPRLPHRPARSHAALPHVSAKPHRSVNRGGQPYPIGQASLSIGLETRGMKPASLAREGATDPSQGVLKGRSPPRGDPSADSRSLPHGRSQHNLSARTAAVAYAPMATPFESAAAFTPAATPLESAAVFTPAASSPDDAVAMFARSAASSPLVQRDRPARPSGRSSGRAFITTTDRAPEGGPAGPFMPSWRCHT